ncbi:MAG: 50S ribosomal protein L20 [Victivallales bacterium]
MSEENRKSARNRRLWTVRINAACRMMDFTYSKLMNGLKKANINVNRKVIADLAVNDAEAFKALVEKAKAAC